MRIKQHNCLYGCHSGIALNALRYRRVTENVTKITSNIPLQVSLRQQELPPITVQMCIS